MFKKKKSNTANVQQEKGTTISPPQNEDTSNRATLHQNAWNEGETWKM